MYIYDVSSLRVKFEGDFVAVAGCTSSIKDLKQSKIPRRRYSYCGDMVWNILR